MGNYIAPLDLRKILIDYFLGSTVLFSFALILIYSFVAAKFSFSNKIYYTLLVIISVIMGVYLGEALYVLILIITGFGVFKIAGKFVT